VLSGPSDNVIQVDEFEAIGIIHTRDTQAVLTIHTQLDHTFFQENHYAAILKLPVMLKIMLA